MQAERYFGTYARFNTLSKKDAAILLGADNPIGDVFEIVFQTDNGVSTAWMKNRFGALIGFLESRSSFQAFHSYNGAASFRWRATGNRSRRARCRTGNLQQW